MEFSQFDGYFNLSRCGGSLLLNLKKPIDLMFSFDEEIGCVGIQKAIPFIKKMKHKVLP